MRDTEMNKLADKVVARMVNAGWNEQDARKIVEANIDDAVRMNIGTSPAKIHEIILAIM